MSDGLDDGMDDVKRARAYMLNEIQLGAFEPTNKTHSTTLPHSASR
jgi:hypothetical protein